jgi:elongation factor Ts
MVTALQVKELRDQTGLGMMDCKRALVETDGDVAKAIELLRKRGMKRAEKRSGRATSEGRIGQYLHQGSRIGVMVELNCETDFVARNDTFAELLKDLAMHIAAAAPKYVAREDVPDDVVAKEKEIYADQVAGKPEHIMDKILEGKLKDFYKQICLLEQPFVKDPGKTVRDVLTEGISRTGENMTIKRFVRYEVGEED